MTLSIRQSETSVTDRCLMKTSDDGRNFWRVWRERIFRGSCRYAVLSGWRAVPELCGRKSRQSISDMMNICPEYANIEEDGVLTQVDPDDVEVGTIIVVNRASAFRLMES